MHRVSSLDDSPSIRSLFSPLPAFSSLSASAKHFSSPSIFPTLSRLFQSGFSFIIGKILKKICTTHFLLSITGAIIFLHLISTISPTTLAFLPLLCLLFWFAGSLSVMTLLYPPAHTCININVFEGCFWYIQISRSSLKVALHTSPFPVHLVQAKDHYRQVLS